MHLFCNTDVLISGFVSAAALSSKFYDAINTRWHRDLCICQENAT